MAQNFIWQDLWWLKRWERHEVIKLQSSILLFHPISKQPCRGCEGIGINFWYCRFLSSEMRKTNKESKLFCESQFFKQIAELPSSFRVEFGIFSTVGISVRLTLKCLGQPFPLPVWDQRHHRALFWASWVGKERGQGKGKAIRGHPRECPPKELGCLRCYRAL